MSTIFALSDEKVFQKKKWCKLILQTKDGAAKLRKALVCVGVKSEEGLSKVEKKGLENFMSSSLEPKIRQNAAMPSSVKESWSWELAVGEN